MARILSILAPLYTILIIYLSLTDNQIQIVSVSYIDKVYHASAYALMTGLWYLFFYTRFLKNSGMGNSGITVIIKSWSKVVAIGAGVLSFVIGVLVEIGQEYIAINRTMDLLDGLANSIGIIIALLILYLASKKFNVE